MSLSATAAALPHAPSDTRRLLLLIWGVVVATYLVARSGSGLSTDDAMRLVQVRDLIAGQGWFDLTQYRLAPPDGIALHWSRLIDLPLAVLIRGGEWLVPTATAEALALTVWPAVLLLALLAAVARIARELADEVAGRLALIFAAMVAPVLQHFRPGAIDHHNAQLVLTVWALALILREQPRDAALAGALCALSLAIGQETAPAIAALAGFVAMRWIARGEPSKTSARAFGAAFAGGLALLFFATVPPERYAVASCDTLSIVQLSTAIVGGLGLALLATWRGSASIRLRLAGATGLGGILAAMVTIAFPTCLADPYAGLDPRLTTLWLANVNEARSIVAMLRDLPQEVLPYYGLPLVALVLGLYRCRQEAGSERWAWIGATAVLAMATLIALWQVRGGAAANVLALAVAAPALVRGLPLADGNAVLLGLGRRTLIVAFLISPPAMIVAGKVIAGAAETTLGMARPQVISDGIGTCQSPADYAPLALLPNGVVLAFIDAGPMILAQSGHRVLAAPFHRNVSGNAAMFDIFLGPPAEAGTRLAANSVDYVAFCPGAPERHNYAAAAPEGLAAALARGETPDALEHMPIKGTDLMVFRRRPATAEPAPR